MCVFLAIYRQLEISSILDYREQGWKAIFQYLDPIVQRQKNFITLNLISVSIPNFADLITLNASTDKIRITVTVKNFLFLSKEESSVGFDSGELKLKPSIQNIDLRGPSGWNLETLKIFLGIFFFEIIPT